MRNQYAQLLLCPCPQLLGQSRLTVHPSWFSSGLEVTLTAGWLSLSIIYSGWVLAGDSKLSLGSEMTQQWDRAKDGGKTEDGKRVGGTIEERITKERILLNFPESDDCSQGVVRN